jgi:serine phosphatase RsbU (regulator of sigma subunit)/Tfp pilus assembly protein PilF
MKRAFSFIARAADNSYLAYAQSHKPVSSFENIDKLNAEAWELRRTDVNRTYAVADEAWKMALAEGYRKGIAEGLRTLGYCAWQFSDYPLALERSMEALELFKQLDDKKGQADTVSSLGAVYAFMGDDENRLKYNLDCLRLRKETGDLEGELITMNNIGDTYMKLGDYTKALEYFSKCLDMSGASDHNRAIVLLNIGEVHYILNNHARSYDHLLRSIEVSEKHNYTRFTIAGYMLLGKLFTRSGDTATALSWLQKALELATEIANNEYLYEIHEALADVYEKKGDVSEAYMHFRTFHSIKEKVLNEDIAGKIRNLQLHYQVQSAQKETEIERIKNTELKKAYEEIEVKKNEILDKNKQITDSIQYAQRIQEAILPSGHEVKKLLKNSFILYRPKDIVSGDFYWVEKKGSKIIIAAVDCTGHGVPGAFMSIIGHNLLNQVVKEQGITKPSDVLDHLNIGVTNTLKQSSAGSTVRDGMDIAMCRIDPEEMTLNFSGANNPLYFIRNGALAEIKGDKTPIGMYAKDTFRPFTDHKLELQEGDTFYLFSDGYADQFGGERGKKFKYKQLQSLLLSIQPHTMEEQLKIVGDTLTSWQGNIEQVDDILVIGVRI